MADTAAVAAAAGSTPARSEDALGASASLFTGTMPVAPAAPTAQFFSAATAASDVASSSTAASFGRHSSAGTMPASFPAFLGALSSAHARTTPVTNAATLGTFGFASQPYSVAMPTFPRSTHPLAAPYHHPGPSIFDIHIEDRIKFKVDSTGQNYSKWRLLMLFLLHQHNARHHIEDPEPHFDDDLWRKEDIQIILWMCGTLSDDLINAVMSIDCTAYTAWTRLHNFFLDNQSSRAMYLGKAYRNTPRGDMPIAAYCDKLKSLADALADVNAPVTDRDLTLQMLAGLGKKFELHGAIIENIKPLPSFVEARSKLQLAELALDEQAATAAAQALAVHGDRGAPASQNAHPHPSGGQPSNGQPGRGGQQYTQGGQYNQGGQRGGQQQPQGGRGNRGRGRGRGGGRGDRGDHAGRGGQQQQQPSGGGQQPWLGYFAPMGAPFPQLNHRQPWVPPNAGSVLGPHVGNQARAYQVQHAGPPAAPYPVPAAPYYGPPSWDHPAMIQTAPSFQPVQYQPAAYQPEWHMDSGASSHVTGTSGPHNSEYSSSLE